MKLDELDKLSDESVTKEVIKVKGIGPWTAEMFLMFTLERPDVFSHGDLGLRKAIKNLYRTYASRILWKSLEVQ